MKVFSLGPTFCKALPLVGGALGTAAVGIVVKTTADSITQAVIGVALGILGATGFCAVVVSGWKHSESPEAFQKSMEESAFVAGGIAVTGMILFAIRVVVQELHRQINRSFSN